MKTPTSPRTPRQLDADWKFKTVTIKVPVLVIRGCRKKDGRSVQLIRTPRMLADALWSVAGVSDTEFLNHTMSRSAERFQKAIRRDLFSPGPFKKFTNRIVKSIKPEAPRNE